jgi:hypothetical protein
LCKWNRESKGWGWLANKTSKKKKKKKKEVQKDEDETIEEDKAYSEMVLEEDF